MCTDLAVKWLRSLTVALVLLAACTPPASPLGQTLTYGLTLVPTGFDPHINASAELGIPLSGVYDTLVFQDPAAHTFVAGLADKWDIADDGLTYTFHLRSGVKFHDGAAFDARAVCLNLERIANPDNQSQKARGMLGPSDVFSVSTMLKSMVLRP